MSSTIYDNRVSTLGEGPLWHPLRNQLFWFDILGGVLHSRGVHGPKTWELGEFGSAAGWIDLDHLLIATETGLWRFHIPTGERSKVADIEASDGSIRSNDGRADPWGGFWIGTMSKDHTEGAGAIYRYYRGETRRLFDRISTPNAICFAPDRSRAFYADTNTQKVMQVALSADQGWPAAEPSVFIDFSGDGINPDGAIVDADGLMWIAQWGASRVAAYDPDGRLVKTVAVKVPQTTCPAFGDPDLTTLFITTARENMDINAIAEHPESGMVFEARDVGRGRPEYQVLL